MFHIVLIFISFFISQSMYGSEHRDSLTKEINPEASGTIEQVYDTIKFILHEYCEKVVQNVVPDNSVFPTHLFSIDDLLQLAQAEDSLGKSGPFNAMLIHALREQENISNKSVT